MHAGVSYNVMERYRTWTEWRSLKRVTTAHLPWQVFFMNNNPPTVTSQKIKSSWTSREERDMFHFRSALNMFQHLNMTDRSETPFQSNQLLKLSVWAWCSEVHEEATCIMHQWPGSFILLFGQHAVPLTDTFWCTDCLILIPGWMISLLEMRVMNQV